MYDQNGCCGGYCEPEEMTIDDQKALLEERKKILKAKLETVDQLLKNLDKRSDSDK